MQFGIRVGQQFKAFVNKGWDIDEEPQLTEYQPSAYLQQVYDMTKILEIERNDLYREVDDLKRQLHLDYKNQCAELQYERDQLHEQKQQQDHQKAQLGYIFDTSLDQIPDRQGVINQLVQDNLYLKNQLKEHEIFQNQQIQDYEDQIEALEQINLQQKELTSQFRNSVRVQLISILHQIQEIPKIEVKQFDFLNYIQQIKDKYVTHIMQLKRSFQTQLQTLIDQNQNMKKELIELQEEYSSLTKILKQVRQSEDQLIEENEQLIQLVNNQIAQIQKLEAQIQHYGDQNQQLEQLSEENNQLQYNIQKKDLQVKALQNQILHMNNQSYLQELDEKLNEQINNLKIQMIKEESEQAEYKLELKQLQVQAELPKEDDTLKIEDDAVDPWELKDIINQINEPEVIDDLEDINPWGNI